MQLSRYFNMANVPFPLKENEVSSINNRTMPIEARWIGAGRRRCLSIKNGINSFLFLAALIGVTRCSAQILNVPRDAKAITILTAVQSAAGWNAIASLHDVTATGSMTYKGGTHSYALRAMSKGRIREEIDQDVSVRNGMKVSERKGDKTSTLLPHMAPSKIPIAFPFWTALELWQHADTELAYEGTATVNGVTTDVIEVTSRNIVKSLPSRDPKLAKQTFYISQETHLPVRLVIRQPATYSPFASVPITYDWMSYQPYSGIFVPTKISASVMEKQLYEVDIQSVALNSGMDDSSFTLSN